MTETLKNLIAGAGSIMEVIPKSDYSRFVPVESAEERMRNHWARTGEHLSRAMDRFEREQESSK